MKINYIIQNIYSPCELERDISFRAYHRMVKSGQFNKQDKLCPNFLLATNLACSVSIHGPPVLRGYINASFQVFNLALSLRLVYEIPFVLVINGFRVLVVFRIIPLVGNFRLLDQSVYHSAGSIRRFQYRGG